MAQTRRSRRVKTLDSEPTHRVTQSLHDGMNYLHQLNFSHLKIRNSKKPNTIRSHSIIEGTPIYQTLKDNKIKLEHIKTEINQQRDLELNDYLKKSIRYQQLLNINDNKKKRLATLNTKIGAVVKKSVTDAYQKQVHYKLFISSINIQGWKPESRQGHSAIINSNKEELIIFGGHCSSPFSIIHVYSFTSNSWIKQIITEIPRSYHSTIVYKNRFAIVFGGMGIYNKSRKSRDCYNSITLFDLLNYSARSIKMHNQESVEPRRCHSSVILGKYMLVLGGINSKKQFLNDFIYLDLKQLRWYHKEYKIESRELQDFLQYGIAKHCAISTFKYRKSYAFFSSDYEESQCVYFVGGFNEKQDSNIIFQLALNQYVPTFKRVQYSGTPPSPVNPIVQKYYGQNDTMIIVSGEITERQIRLFKMKERTFIYVNNYMSITSIGGYGSSLNYYNGDYYLFFGLGAEGYLGQITKLRIQEQTKESQKKRKLTFTKHDFKEQNQRSDSSSSSESDNGKEKKIDY